MIVAAHQPHYMPWLGYLDKMAKADLFVVMDDLQYEAQNFQNRQRIKLHSGAQWITVPLERGTQADRICDKRIDNTGSRRQHWQRRTWMTLEINYRRAPYWQKYADELRAVYAQTWVSLLELDMKMLDLARNWLHIKTPIVRASSLNLQGQKTDRILDMCKKVGARCYLSGGGGSTDYLNVEQIGRAGVGLIWQHFEHPRYTQRYPEAGFLSHLGFIDLVLNHGEQSRDHVRDVSSVPVGGSMNRILQEKGGRVLAFGAHPDDLEVGAGGLLARLSHEGAEVTLAIVSIPNNTEQRKNEAHDAAKVLDANLFILNEDKPCRVEDIPMHELVRRMDTVIGDVRPDLVITHSANDLHWDHGLVNRATVSALRRTPCDLLAYLSSPEMNAQSRSLGNCFADVSKYVDVKLDAIACHKSQLPKLDLESSRDLARAMGRISGYEYAECYEVLRVRI